MENIPVFIPIISGACCFLAIMAAAGAFLVWMLTSRKKLPCPECGEVNPPGNKFCEQCGSPLEDASSD